jgi:hypothetical protein
MKSILFFSRLELTNFFGRLDKHLSEDFMIYHLAYSQAEDEILKTQYGIKEVFVFKKMVSELLPNCKLDLSIIKKIDELFIRMSNGRFCLNSAIRYDRSFKFLNYNDCLILAQCYYIFWNKFLDDYPVQAIFHEPPAIFITHLLANIAKDRGIFFLSQSQVVGENKFNWLMIEGDNGCPIELVKNLESPKGDDSEYKRTKSFIRNFRSKSEVLFFEYSRMNKPRNKIAFIKDSLAITVKVLKTIILEGDKDFPLIDHIDTFMVKGRPSYLEQLYNNWYYYYNLKYDEFINNQNYYFYPLHAEPEAAVLYRGDGVYEGQVKLIENIAEQLPPNCFLYIKDHPHKPAFVDMINFKRLKLIPNVRLLDPSLIGTEIIKHSKGVITISGTAGFEALLLNKQVYIFGNSFYSFCSRVITIKNVKEFREVVYKNFDNKYEDDLELFQFIHAFLMSSHQGFVSYFPRTIKCYKLNHEENINNVADEFRKILSSILQFNNEEMRLDLGPKFSK